MAKKRSYGVELVIKGRDLASATIGKIGRNLKMLAAPVRGLMSIGRGLGSLIEKIPGLTFLGAGISYLGGEVRSLTAELGDLAGNLADLTGATGLGVRAIQSAGFAFQKAGVPADEYHSALRRMTTTLGKGVAARQLGMLGKGATGFARALKAAKGPGDKFELVLSQMAAIEDPTKRAAFAATFFGKAGVKMAAAAEDGAEGLKAMRQQAEDLGLVMDEDEVKRADEFSDTYESLGMVLSGAKRGFGSGLIEGLLPAMRDLLAWTKDNRKEIGAFVKDLGRKVGTGIIDAAKGIKSAVEWVVNNKDTILDVAAKIASAFTALLGLKLLGGMGGLLGGLGGAAGGAVAGAAAGGGGGAAAGGIAMLARAVGGPAALATLLPDQGEIETASQKKYRDADREGRNNLRSAYGIAPVDYGALDRAYQGTVDALPADTTAAVRNSILGGMSSMNKGIEQALDAQIQKVYADQMKGGMTPERAAALRGMAGNSDIENAERMRWAAGGGDPNFTGPPQMIEVKVVVEDKGNNTDGNPQVKAPAGTKVKTTTSGDTGRRSTIYANGGK